MVGVGDQVGDLGHLALHRPGPVLLGVYSLLSPSLGVLGDSLPHLEREVKTRPSALEHLHDPHALADVPKPPGNHLVESLLARVAEGGVSYVVAEGDGLGQVLVQQKGPRDRPGYLGDLDHVREPRAVMVVGGGDEHLGLVLQPAKRLGVHYPVAVPLEARSYGALLFRDGPSRRFAAESRHGGKRLSFVLFRPLPYEQGFRTSPSPFSLPLPRGRETPWPRLWSACRSGKWTRRARRRPFPSPRPRAGAGDAPPLRRL